MTDEQYTRWAKEHALRFGFREQADVDMLLSWFEILGCEEASDLAEASRRLARSDYPSFARDHLKALLPLIRFLRAERCQGALIVDGPDRGTCVTCAGQGRVIVPHPCCVRDGQWEPGGSLARYYTAVVACSCALGRWYQAHGMPTGREARPMMGLVEYEDRVCPNWRGEMRVRALREAAEVKATAAPASRVVNQEQLDRVLDRLAEHFGRETP